MTKIDIFSGFLGAGKTTLIKKLIDEGYKNEKIALIENEFGEIGIDGGFLKEAGVNITEMNSGCICCSLVGDFGKALNEVISTYSPDRVIIEPSGVGKLSDVIKAVNNLDLLNSKEKKVQIDNYVTIVDATKCKMYMKNFKEFFDDQLKSAKAIILSRTQRMNEEKLKQTIELIREVNKNAALITTPWDDLSGEDIIRNIENNNSFENDLINETKHHHDEDHEHDHHEKEHCSCNHHHEHDHHDEEHCSCNHHHEHDHHEKEHCSCHHHHDADEVFTSIGFETIHEYSKEEMDNILKKLSSTNEYGTILRSKGIVKGKEKWIYFDLVSDEYEIRFGNPDVTGKICVIGTEIKEDKIKELFNV